MADKTSLFSISCGTCAARLTVRNESAIGQVLACPRCGSMVMVDPPEGWVAPEGDPLPPLPRRPRDLNDSQATLSNEFDDLGSELTSARPRSRPSQRNPLAPPIQQSVSSPILPDGTWDSNRSVERRKTMTWIGAIIGICLVALTAIVWLIVSMTGEVERLQTAEDNGSNPVALDGAIDKTQNDPVPETEPAPELVSPPENTDTKAIDPGQVEVLDPNPKTDKTDSDEPPTDPPVALAPSDDPLVAIDASMDVSPPDDAKALEDGTGQKSFIEEVGPLQEIFTDPGMDVAIDNVGESRQDSLIGLGKIFVPRPRARNPDFEKQLNDRFPEVDVDQVPLVEFVRTLNLISGIPIHLDTHSVTYGHLRPLEKITYTGTDQSLVNILNTALQSQNLVAIPDPENFVVVVASKNNDVFAERKLQVDPAFVGDEVNREFVVELIKNATGPERWNIGEIPSRIGMSETEVTVESTGILYDEVRFMLNKLTAAARLNSSPDDVAANEAVRSCWMGSVAIFQAECTFNEIQLKPASQIMNQVTRNEKLVVLLDWRSLMKEGWNLDTQLPWPGEGSIVEDTLTDITSSMGLAWRMLGPAMVQITSQEQYRNGTRFEVYPCASVLKKYSIEQVMGILQAQLYSDVKKTKSWTRVDYFPAGNCIVAQLPDPLQIRLEMILTELARQ